MAFSCGTEDGTMGHPASDVLRGDGQKVTIGYVRCNSQKLCIVFRHMGGMIKNREENYESKELPNHNSRSCDNWYRI